MSENSTALGPRHDSDTGRGHSGYNGDMPRIQSGYSVPVDAGESRGEPFRGVRPFDRESAEVFAGRKPEIASLMDLVGRADFRAGVLVGDAGVGKTSLLCAGLIPRLERVGTLPVYVDGAAGVIQALRQALFRASASPPRSDEETVAYAVRLTERWPEGVLLMFDDVDEQLQGEAADDFAAALKELLHAGRGQLKVLFAVDSSAFYRLSELEQRVEAAIPPACRMRLDPLDEQRAADAIEEGVLASGIYFEKGMSRTIAMDLTRDGPVSPLDLQLTVTAAIERRVLSARRYARSGGAAVLRARWLRDRLRQAGPTAGLVVLSELADRRQSGAGWCSPEDLAAASGIEARRLKPVLDRLTRDHLLAARDEPAGLRLAQQALVPLLRGLDGTLRARRLRARLTLQNRLHAGGLLRPMELLRARHAQGATPQERRLLSRSRWANLGALVLLLGLVVGLGAWVHLRAGSGYHLGLGGSPGAPDRTLVVRRGLPAYDRWTPLPHRPAVGAVLVDTGLPADALGPRAAARLGGLTGELTDRHGRWPRWFAQMLDLLKPTERGQLLLLLGRPQAAWKLLARTATTPAALRRILGVIGVVGRAEAEERALLARAVASRDGALRRLATRSALAVAARKAGAYPDLLRRLARDPDPAVQLTLLQHVQPLGARRALGLARHALGRPNPALRRLAVSLADWGADQAPREASAVLAGSAHDLASRPAARARLTLERLLRTHPTAAAAGITAALAATPSPAARRQLLSWLVMVPPKKLPAPLVPMLLTLAAGTDRAVARTALKLALGRAPAARLVPVLHRLAAAVGPAGAPQRVLAADGFRALLKRGAKVDLPQLQRLAQDPAEDVRVAATRAYGAAPASELLAVMKLGGDRAARVRAEAVEAMATLGNPQPYRILKTLEAMTQGGGARLRAALATAASHLVRSDRYWSIAKNYVIAASRSGSPTVRRAATLALGRLAGLRTDEVLEALGKLTRDADPAVRLALVKTLRRVGRHNALKAGLMLVKLVRDTDARVVRAALRAMTALVKEPLVHRTAALALSVALPGNDAVCLAALGLLGRLPTRALPRELDASLARAFGAARSEDLRRALLAEAGRVAAAETIRRASQSPEPTLRAEALRMAARAGGAKAAQVVLAALKDADPAVRHAALGAASRLLDRQSRALVPALLDVATDPHDALRLEALAALGAARDQTARVRRVLAAATRSPRVAVRQTAAQALSRSARQGGLLDRLLRDPALEVRRAAVLAQAQRWARARRAADLARTLAESPKNRQHRLAAALALHLLRRPGNAQATAAAAALGVAARSRRPLAALLAGAALLVPPTPTGHQRLGELLDHIFLF
jgi:HEAT repeat protein